MDYSLPGLPGACSNSCPLSRWCHPNYLIHCRSLLLLPSIFPSIRDFSNKSVLCIRWPKYWSFSFRSVLPMNIQGWFSLELTSLLSLLSEGLSKSLPQHHSLTTLILQCPAFFMVQHSHLYMTTRKTIALAIGTSVGKVMYLLFNMLSRLIIVFLLRSKCL